MTSAEAPDWTGLMLRLAAIVGARNLLTAPADLAPYLADERGLYPGAARAVVRPGGTAEVAAVLAATHAARVAVVPQGGNTGLVGGGAAPAGSLILSLGRMNRIREVDAANATLTAEAGAILKTVQDAARSADRLFPLSLASEGSAQIGGLLATNAGGIAVLRYGNMRDVTLGIEAVLPGGRVLSLLNALRKDNTGYDLRNLLIGAEGTLGVITAAVLRLHPLPAQRTTTFAACGTAVQAQAFFTFLSERAGASLAAFEYISAAALRLMAGQGIALPFPPAAEAGAFVLFDLTAAHAGAPLAAETEALVAEGFERGWLCDGTIGTSEAQNLALWSLREHLPEVQKRAGASIKHDIAVPLSHLPEFLDLAGAACAAHLPGVAIVPFGHLGDGNLHYNLAPPPGMDRADFQTHQPAFNRIVHDITDRLGGSISAEHGIGQMKRGELVRYKDPVAVEVMRAIKAALDPLNLMNPGKLLPAETL